MDTISGTTGKYEGLTFEEVYKTNKWYCNFILNYDKNNSRKLKNKSLLHFREFLRKKESTLANPEPKEAPRNIITSGKHEGKTFEEVYQTNKWYCNFILSYDENNSRKLKDASLIRFREFLRTK